MEPVNLLSANSTMNSLTVTLPPAIAALQEATSHLEDRTAPKAIQRMLTLFNEVKEKFPQETFSLDFFIKFTADKAKILFNSNLHLNISLIDDAKNVLTNGQSTLNQEALKIFLKACTRLESPNPITPQQNLQLIQATAQAIPENASPFMSAIHDAFLKERIESYLQRINQHYTELSVQSDTSLKDISAAYDALITLAEKICDQNEATIQKTYIQFSKTQKKNLSTYPKSS